MRISFDFEIRFPNIRQKAKELICQFKGHDWKKYKRPTDLSFLSYGILEHMDFYYSRKPIKKCKRCGEIKYKKITEQIGEKFNILSIKKLREVEKK